jgi:hypothetical protein
MSITEPGTARTGEGKNGRGSRIVLDVLARREQELQTSSAYTSCPGLLLDGLQAN